MTPRPCCQRRRDTPNARGLCVSCERAAKRRRKGPSAEAAFREARLRYVSNPEGAVRLARWALKL